VVEYAHRTPLATLEYGMYTLAAVHIPPSVWTCVCEKEKEGDHVRILRV